MWNKRDENWRHLQPSPGSSRPLSDSTRHHARFTVCSLVPCAAQSRDPELYSRSHYTRRGRTGQDGTGWDGTGSQAVIRRLVMCTELGFPSGGLLEILPSFVRRHSGTDLNRKWNSTSVVGRRLSIASERGRCGTGLLPESAGIWTQTINEPNVGPISEIIACA